GGWGGWQPASVAAVDPLLQVRLLRADGGGLPVPGQYPGLAGQGEQLVPDGGDDRVEVRIRAPRGSRSAGEQRVPGEQHPAIHVRHVEARGSRGVPRGVDRLQGDLVLATADGELLAVVDDFIGGGARVHVLPQHQVRRIQEYRRV